MSNPRNWGDITFIIASIYSVNPVSSILFTEFVLSLVSNRGDLFPAVMCPVVLPFKFSGKFGIGPHGCGKITEQKDQAFFAGEPPTHPTRVVMTGKVFQWFVIAPEGVGNVENHFLFPFGERSMVFDLR
jgi:hypothetical protein